MFLALLLSAPTVVSSLSTPTADPATSPGATPAAPRRELLESGRLNSHAWTAAPAGVESWLQPADARATSPQAPADTAPVEREPSDTYANLYPKFYLSLGFAAYAGVTSTAQVTGNVGVGAVVDFEQMLNLDDSANVGRLDLHYAFNKRHWLEASYYDISRDGETGATQQDINFGNVSIPAGSRVKSNFDTRIIKLTYRYNFVTDERTVIGASFGVHSMELNIAMNAATLALDESFDQELPMPVLGLHGGYALSSTWSLLADAQFLRVDLGEYRGLIADNRVTLEHRPFEHFGWGLGFNGFRLNASAENEDLEADVRYSYEGVMLYARWFL